MSALERARELLGLLRAPATRDLGLARAHELARRTASGEETELLVRSVAVEELGQLSVLTLPSIFAPEEWGRTFLRGLLQAPLESWRGQTVVELGSGSGWVSIALARFTAVARVHALDLNPQASLVTEINAWLAGRDAEGRLVSEKVVPGVSDLLSTLEARDVVADLICGNIPQVLGPEELARAEALTEDAEARVLRMLGDYTPRTGNYEDVLSLGLIASALERALKHLSPEGRIVLNLAGRPGFDVLRWVFARWGYAPRVLHKARVQQDPATDIAFFARAEAATGRRFSFYETRASRQAIGAGEAVSRRASGLDVFHDLYVVEGRPYRNLAIEGARRYLAAGRVPYTEDPGTELEGLRQEAAVYLSCYLRLAARADDVFVAPSRGALLHAAALAAVEPGASALLDDALAAHAPDLERAGLTVVPGGALPLEESLASGRELRLVVAALGTRKNPAALGAARLAELVAACRRLGATLVLDVTFAKIASTQREPDELERLLVDLHRREDALVTIDLGEHLALERGDRGARFPLALGLVTRRYRAIQHVADTTYSRAPSVSQAAHRHVLAVLNERYRGPRDVRAGTPGEPRTGSTLATELAHTPAFEPLPALDPERGTLLRLDFGESEHPVSERLRNGWLEGLGARDPGALEGAAREAAAHFLARSRAAPGAPPLPVSAGELVLSAGAQPLVASVVAAARALGGGRRPVVLLPRPFYGLFPGVIAAARADLAPLTARVEEGRLFLDEQELRFRLERAGTRPVVALLVHPNNPTGAYLDAGTLARTLALLAERGAVALVDEVFFTLRHSPRGEDPVSAIELARRSPEVGARLVVLEGLSKAFAAGGARFGIAWVKDTTLREAVARCSRPPCAGALGAARAQLASFEEDLARHVAWLSGKARQTLAVLAELGLDSVRPEGGLFLSADLTPLEGRRWTGADVWGHEVRGERPPVEDFRATLAAAAGLVVSPDHWSGWALPHRRLVFSIRELDAALVRLRAFATLPSAARD